MAVRTIFFNGPKGHRWVTAPRTDLIEYKIRYTLQHPHWTDACAQHRRRFFGIPECDALQIGAAWGNPRRCTEMLRKDIRRRADVPLLTARVGDCRGRSAGNA